jgi:hypothetical protein
LVLHGPWRAAYADVYVAGGYRGVEINGSLGFEGDNLAFLATLPHVEQLLILTTQLRDDQAVVACRELQILELTSGAKNPLDLTALPSLSRLFLGRGLEPRLRVEGASALKTFDVYGYLGADLSKFSTFPQLDTLCVRPARHLTSVAGTSGLVSLTIQRAPSLDTLDGIRLMRRLKYLNLSTCRYLSDISELAAVPSLRELVLKDCGNLPSLGPIANLNLKRLFLTGDTKVQDGKVRSVVMGMTELIEVGMHGWRHYDATPAEMQRIVFSRTHDPRAAIQAGVLDDPAKLREALRRTRARAQAWQPCNPDEESEV